MDTLKAACNKNCTAKFISKRFSDKNFKTEFNCIVIFLQFEDKFFLKQLLKLNLEKFC